MKFLITLASLGLMSTAFAQNMPKSHGESSLVKAGQGRFVVVISGNSASKIYKDLDGVKQLSDGSRNGEGVTCHISNKKKVCNILIDNALQGTVSTGGGFSADKSSVGATLAYDSLGAGESFIIITGAPAESLFNKLASVTREVMAKKWIQKTGQNYGCDKSKAEKAGQKDSFSCTFSLDHKSTGTVGHPGVG